MGPSASPFVLLPAAMADRINAWGTSWGWLHIRYDKAENLAILTKFSKKNEITLPYTGFSDRGHYSRSIDTIPNAGVWYRVDPDLHALYYHALLRGLTVRVDALEEAVIQGWRQPPADHPLLTITFSDLGGETHWTAWWVDRNGAVPCRFDLVRDKGPLEFLQDAWPVDELEAARVTVVGVGSIGSAAAEALGSTGVGHIRLVDPDRLLQHNIARHRLSERDIGRHKVTALAEHLRARFTTLDVEALIADVAADADVMRPLFSDSDVVVCATDGVQSRRVANHLARRAGVPLVLAAVLEDGCYGELVRVWNRTGCLLCLRRELIGRGVFDPEPGLDQDYGTGSPHRPMTAAPHDLRLMGDLACQAAVSTYLERRGRWTHRLPGDWAVIGLQPLPEMSEPFDSLGAGDVKWLALPERQVGCPTCTPP